MGGHNFSCALRGRTASEAYTALVTDATYEYGHDPYNGTISTTTGFIDVTGEFDLSQNGGDQILNDGRFEKWGNCAAIKDGSECGLDLWVFIG